MRRLGWAAALAFCCAAQTGPQSGIEALAGIRQRMSRNLAELPNFTCLQTIERHRRASASARFEIQDRLRLEVAQVGSKELFAWPGGSGFEDQDLQKFAGGGMTGTGDFALQARSIFLSGAASFAFAGEETLGRRRVLRFDYRVPAPPSGMKLGNQGRFATVSYHGSFWADADSRDLVRIRLRADEIPAELGLAEVTGELHYARLPLGERSFLLPEVGETAMVFASGTASLNRTTFARCRQFSAESLVSFDSAPDSPGSTVRKRDALELPEGLLVESRLETVVDSRDAAAGDLVTLRVSHDVRRDRKLLVPRGAVLTGRLRVLEWRRSPYPYLAFGVQLSEISFDAVRAPFSAALDEIGSLEGLFAASGRFTPVRSSSRPSWFRGVPDSSGAAGHRPGPVVSVGRPRPPAAGSAVDVEAFSAVIVGSPASALRIGEERQGQDDHDHQGENECLQGIEPPRERP